MHCRSIADEYLILALPFIETSLAIMLNTSIEKRQFPNMWIANQLYQYMNENNMISSNQPGFWGLHSTLTCLLKNTDDWYSGLDPGKLVGLVFIDLKAGL